MLIRNLADIFCLGAMLVRSWSGNFSMGRAQSVLIDHIAVEMHHIYRGVSNTYDIHRLVNANIETYNTVNWRSIFPLLMQLN